MGCCVGVDDLANCMETVQRAGQGLGDAGFVSRRHPGTCSPLLANRGPRLACRAHRSPEYRRCGDSGLPMGATATTQGATNPGGCGEHLATAGLEGCSTLRPVKARCRYWLAAPVRVGAVPPPWTYPRPVGWRQRLGLVGQLYEFFGNCPDCGHDWREHIPPAVDDGEPCSECTFEIDHQEPEAPSVPCQRRPDALPPAL